MSYSTEDDINTEQLLDKMEFIILCLNMQMTDFLKVVLDLYNKIWVEGRMPKSWKHAIIIPIAKPGKDASIAAENYRPIALT